MLISETYNEDCMLGMSRYPDKYFDLAPVDPNWGRKEDGGKDRGKKVLQANGATTFVTSGDYIIKTAGDAWEGAAQHYGEGRDDLKESIKQNFKDLGLIPDQEVGNHENKL